MTNKQIYCGGDMLKYGSQLQREEEKQQLQKLGYSIYSPKDDKEINDKSNQTEESNNNLAERIVEKDTNGIMFSDIVTIEPHENALGTMVELGQIKGMRDAYQIITGWLHCHHREIGEEVEREFKKMFDKPVFPYCRDIRRTEIPEKGDRRSWGINQYVYGVCLDLSYGKGLYEWEEILNILE